MIKLYGPKTSRVLMCGWVLDELGVEYQHVDMSMEEIKAPAFREKNLNAKVPVLEDGDLVLFESMAIALYLVKTYGAGTLWPADEADQARALQWAFWSATELEPNMVTMFGQTLFTPPDQRDEKKLADAREKVDKALAVLNETLADRDWLLGAQFSVSDINAASVLAPAHRLLKMDLSHLPHVERWQQACAGRRHYEPMAAALQAFEEKIKQGPPGGGR